MHVLRPLLLIGMLTASGCSLVVDFDRSLLIDAGTDGGVDASVEAGAGEAAEDGDDVSPAREADAG